MKNQYDDEEEDDDDEIVDGSVSMEPGIESSFNESDGRAYKRGPYKSYTMDEKLKAV